MRKLLGPSSKVWACAQIGHSDNKLTIWGTSLPQELAEFLDAQARYRVTIAVLGRQLRLEVDWRSKHWNAIEVRSR
jgi:hypothetical protein